MHAGPAQSERKACARRSFKKEKTMRNFGGERRDHFLPSKKRIRSSTRQKRASFMLVDIEQKGKPKISS